MINFADLLQTIRFWGSKIYVSFSNFGEWATSPIVPLDSPLSNFLDNLNWALNPVFTSLINKYFPHIDTLWNLSFLDLVVTGAVLVLVYNFIKWVIGLL